MSRQNKTYDIVYIVKEDPHNEELRYSIRSVVENFPVRNIWIFGYRPKWLKEVIHVNIPQNGQKWENSKMLFDKIANCESLPDEFVLFNDDFFVVEPVDKVEYYYDGLLQDRIDQLREAFKNQHPLYADQLQQIVDRLAMHGITEPKNYAVHKPMLFNRKKMKESIELTKDLPMSLRSFYGNYYNVGGIDAPDTKVFRLGEYDFPGPYLSSDDRTFRLGRIGRDIRAKFNEPSQYEY